MFSKTHIMNYTINIDKLINLITIAKGQAHVLPTDVLYKSTNITNQWS